MISAYIHAGLYSSLPSTDILLTHGPPHSIGGLDLLTDGVTHVGCEELADKVIKGETRPTLFCFGHIHGESIPVTY
jgi:Icc-related predicted phosphoesterase